jgi:hypothetical protein
MDDERAAAAAGDNVFTPPHTLSEEKSPMSVTTPHLQTTVFNYDDVEPRGRIGSAPVDIRRSPSPSRKGASPQQHSPSILSRTIGSISSMGSFAGAQIVDFSSGLFTRSQEDRGRVKDLAEVEPEQTPPRTSWLLGAEEERRIDVEVESVVKLDDKPELFKPLDGECRVLD